MECALASYFDYRQNLIVPCVHWGFGLDMHECDLLMMSKHGYLTEIEIKVTRADLRADAKKTHGHRHARIKYLWFALPDYLENAIQFVPERAGIILVQPWEPGYQSGPKCRKIRTPTCVKHAPKMTDRERYKLARLGTLRIWNLKRQINGR
jgi:hypothetical protein